MRNYVSLSEIDTAIVLAAMRVLSDRLSRKETSQDELDAILSVACRNPVTASDVECVAHYINNPHLTESKIKSFVVTDEDEIAHECTLAERPEDAQSKFMQLSHSRRRCFPTAWVNGEEKSHRSYL